jgi:hypothetical protein
VQPLGRDDELENAKLKGSNRALLKIIASIEDPQVIGRILEHLGLDGSGAPSHQLPPGARAADRIHHYPSHRGFTPGGSPDLRVELVPTKSPSRAHATVSERNRVLSPLLLLAGE